MINPTTGSAQFPNNILQTGLQQNQPAQHNVQDKRAETNKPQENRKAELSSTQQGAHTQNKNFQEIAESILAARKSDASSSGFQPAIERGAIVDITV